MYVRRRDSLPFIKSTDELRTVQYALHQPREPRGWFERLVSHIFFYAMVNAFSLVIDALGVSPSQASTENKREAARKKDATRKREEYKLRTDADRKRDLDRRRAQYKLLSVAARKEISNRARARRAPRTDAVRKRDKDRKKAKRKLWTDADLANETAQKQRWRAEQWAKKVKTDKVANNERTLR